MNQIDTYLQNVTPSQRVTLERIREIIKQIEPEAEETISYGMPALKYKNKTILHFAAFKNHMSIFPTGDPMEELVKDIGKFRTSKGTLQFTEDNPIPEPILKKIIKYRLRAITEK